MFLNTESIFGGGIWKRLRLTKGEKRNFKRMATVASVYSRMLETPDL
ncbi:hypothetical protein [Calothrix sp. PCC 6303]|nr:hypothetical protein [Calothrix sp. PCC 6303]AFZ01828.1 hypothetical protein Cal6303_2873 [Calothrix sp. PCC 6303]